MTRDKFNHDCIKAAIIGILALAAGLALLLLPNLGWAADIPLAWDSVTGADSYIVEMSTDQGQTWSESRNATNASLIWTDAPDTGLLLFRVSAVNEQGQATRTESGAWYCGDWDLPDEPAGMGVQ